MLDDFFISKIITSDGETIELSGGDIVVFVGPNNSGKTKTLTSIYQLIYNHNRKADHYIDIEFNRLISGPEIANLVKKYGIQDRNNLSHWKIKGGTVSLPKEGNEFGSAPHKNATPFDNLFNLFVCYMPVDQRFSGAWSSKPIDKSTPKTSPIHYLQYDHDLELSLSKYVEESFDKSLILDRNYGTLMPHIGDRPDFPNNDPFGLKYSELISPVPRMDEQGAGLKSFIWVMLNLTCSKNNYVIIDEPDLLLHPPQSFQLGKMIPNWIPDQVFIATHSSHILRGLVESGGKRIKIVRLSRDEEKFSLYNISQECFENVKSDPILKFTNALDGIFFHHVVLCESEADCLFYKGIATECGHIKASKPIFWLGVNGKQNFRAVVEMFDGLGVNLSIIPDFDLLNDEDMLKGLLSSRRGNWENIDRSYRILSGNVDWKRAKHAGINAVPRGDAFRAVDQIIEYLNSIGVFVSPFGEMEDFCRSIAGKGDLWVGEILRNMDLISDPELENARNFTATVFS